jgi:hypothetical protein
MISTGDSNTVSVNIFALTFSNASYPCSIGRFGSSFFRTSLVTVNNINFQDSTSIGFWISNKVNFTVSNFNAANVAITSTSNNAIFVLGSSTLGTNVAMTTSSFQNILGGVVHFVGDNSINCRLSIYNSQFQNVNKSGAGGAISASCSLDMQNVTFSKCSSQAQGGAIYLWGSSSSTAKMINVSADMMTSVSNGGGFAYLASRHSVDISSSSLSNCVSLSGDGGAINSLGSISIFSQVNFSKCTASGYGGALSFGQSSPSNVTISGSSFFQTSAQSGGFIYVSGKSSIVSISSSSGVNSTSSSDGGSVYVQDSNLTLTSVVILNSSSQGGSGGTIYADATSVVFLSMVNVSLSKSQTSGGAIFHLGSILRLVRSSFRQCSVQTKGSGGAISSQSSAAAMINLQSCSFDQCQSVSSGGAIDIQSQSSVTINSSTFSSNFAGTVGGAISFLSTGTLNCLNTSFLKNSAGSGGGVLSGSGSLSNVSLRSVNATGNFAASGGVIFTTSSASITSYSSFFVGNIANDGSGGFINCGSACNITLTSVSAEQNSASQKGGAIFISTAGSILVLQDSKIRLNNASQSGGAVYLTSSNLTSNACIIDSNAATSYGGGLSVSALSTTFLNSTSLKGNTASVGGALHHSGGNLSLTISGSNISSNSAVYSPLCGSPLGSGGGIYLESYDCSEKLVLENNTFSGNNASHFGGSIAFNSISSCAVSMLQNTWNSQIFTNNLAGFGTNYASSALLKGGSYPSITSSWKVGFSFFMNISDQFGNNVSERSCHFSSVLNDLQNSGLFTMRVPLPISTQSVNTPGFHIDYALTAQTVGIDGSVVYNFTLEVSSSDLGSETAYLNVSLKVCSSQEFFSSSSQSCLTCSLGKFKALPANSTDYRCISCPAGRYSDTTGIPTSCKVCTAGTFSDSGAASCGPCLPGTFSLDNASACSPCESNFFSPDYASTSCQSCIPTSMTISSSSDSVEKCICDKGSFGQPWSGIACTKCPVQDGASCPLNSSFPYTSPGYWRDPSRPDRILQCIPKLACESTGYSLITQCKEGYSGRLCSSCVSGSYFSVDNTCKSCTGAKFMWILLVFFVVLLIAIGVQVSRTTEGKFFEIKLCVVWIQITSIFLRLSETWPLSLQFIMRTGSTFNFDLPSFRLGCSFVMSFWDFYYISLASPVFFGVLLVSVIYALRRWQLYRRVKLTEAKDYTTPMNQIIHGLIFIILQLFTFVTTFVFRPFKCVSQPDGTHSMYSDPTQDCYSGKWKENLPGMVIFIALYVVVIPVSFGWIMAKYGHRRETDEFKAKFGALTQPYNGKFFWWEIISITKKCIYVIFVDAVSGFQYYERIFYVCLFLFFFVALEAMFLPYATTTLNSINTLWGIFCIVLLLSDALIFNPHAVPDSIETIVVIVLYAIYGYILFRSIGKVVQTQIQLYVSKLIYKRTEERIQEISSAPSPVATEQHTSVGLQIITNNTVNETLPGRASSPRAGQIRHILDEDDILAETQVRGASGSVLENMALSHKAKQPTRKNSGGTLSRKDSGSAGGALNRTATFDRSTIVGTSPRS